MNTDEALNESMFMQWLEGKSGNVYRLLEMYLIETTRFHVSVSFDWLATTEKHEYDSGVWKTWQKHPRWFRRWVRDNAGKWNIYPKDSVEGHIPAEKMKDRIIHG